MKKYWNKKTSTILTIVLGIALFVGGYSFVQHKIDTQVQTEKVLVAKGDIEPYAALTEANTEVVKRTVAEIGDDAVHSLSELKAGDAFATKFGFTSGAIIHSKYVTDADDSQMGSAVRLKNGNVQMAVKADLVTSTGAEIRPNNTVDIYAYIGNQGEAGGRTVADPSLKGIRVIKVKNTEGVTPTTEGGNTGIPAAVVLEVSPDQAAKIVTFQNQGVVYLLLSGMEKS